MSDLRPHPADAPESEASTSGPAAATSPRGTVEEVAAALPESATAAFAALLHLIRLMGADLGSIGPTSIWSVSNRRSAPRSNSSPARP